MHPQLNPGGSEHRAGALQLACETLPSVSGHRLTDLRKRTLRDRLDLGYPVNRRSRIDRDQPTRDLALQANCRQRMT